ncbi:substrate-binding domain-containing protein [Noviherbaspirillum sp. DKR-6]|uniref:Substrate-binding domain-containing protein n=1 Tax=Noviherbaspirillum pedocola TaxID=2801341 RepID=A0A934W2R5_9BURK|nr:substrate-binding domain-containing protein [Noviherbaspirillum pedocola]
MRVCADPNNLPFSNKAGQGFENRLAQLLADAMGARLETAWAAQRRGFIRNNLNAGRCDAVMGVPADYGMTLNTRPYYRSTYVFVTRADARWRPQGLDDPALARSRIGVHVIGSDNPPPAVVLARRGLVDNVVGYSIYGDYREPNPPSALINAVARRDVDVAIAWGPLAGYFAKRAAAPLTLTPIAQEAPALPMQFSIAIGVRKNERALRDRLDALLEQKRPEIDALLREYGVPRADGGAALSASR